MVRTLITCDCQGSQNVDSEALAKATGQDVRKPCSDLCMDSRDYAAREMAKPDRVICCLQEQNFFDELAGEMGAAVPEFLDLRDRAGWSEDGASKTPKMAALIADAFLPASPTKTIDVVSEGLCLIIGPADIALDAAAQLADYLGVTVLLEDGDLPDSRSFDTVKGKLRHARGAFGEFEVVIDALQRINPGGRGAFTLMPSRDGAVSECDIILDLRGRTPLFSAHEKREGYLRADPAHAPSVAAAVMAASHLVGRFEKDMHVRTDPLICAYSRAGQTGCTKCLDLCPTGAITPDGEHISVDPMICAGCGACSAVCPSGAISFDAPPVEMIFRRVQTLAKAYLDAGGKAPRLLVHDAYGAEMIRLSARHGRGLPADVIPMELPAVGAFGHAEMLATLAAGFASVTMVPGPGADRAALDGQLALAHAIGGPVIHLLETHDPDAMSDALFDAEPSAALTSPIRPMGTRRQIARQAARALNPDAAQLPLPEGAPYGAVLVDTSSCTLCLSCVSLCPSGALGDNPDLPQLRFQEDACLQCGLCANICPEDAITYEPRLDLTDAALQERVLHEEEPFACIDCGALFGVKSSVERITERLRNHAMFNDDSKLRMIQMCDDCRIKTQFHSEGNPLTAEKPRRPRTTDDYLNARRDH